MHPTQQASVENSTVESKTLGTLGERINVCLEVFELCANDLSFNSALHSDVLDDSFDSVGSCRRNLVARLPTLSFVIVLLTEDLVERSDCDTVISQPPR